MKKKKTVLGRGLEALLRNPQTDITSNNENHEKAVVGSISELQIKDITINPFQPRSDFDNEKIQELIKSIEKLGIIQPLTVRKLGYNKYQLISGERRLRAAEQIGLEQVPAYIRIANDQEMLEMALVENIQREKLNPIEVALSYKRLIEECKITQERLSERVGKKRSTISNYLRLLKLPAEIQSGLKTDEISMGHARALINIENKETQLNIYQDAINNGFSVRDLEHIVKEFGIIGYKRTSKMIKRNAESFKHQKLTNDLIQTLNRKVKIKIKKSGEGKLEIFFNSEEQLYSIIKYFQE